ncbi:MAG TPA: DUF305 domain-containing protein [Micromonosporaceae bacterium]|jgi:uncharacterized protein (DUF305 family)|nr:DUF305 domain-containing protein [Micromonosporaceae bacterium]
MTGKARWIVAAAVALALLGVGYLGGFLTPSLTAPGDNSPEAGFARDMSVHHAQAVQMSMIEAQSGTMPEVRGLAQSIALTQQAQIGMMTVWLQDWHLNPTGSGPRMAWMPQGSEELVNGLMPGMATQDQINQLINAKGKQVDILYCQLMLRHHLGGIHMVEGLLAESHNSTVRALAETMLTGQQGEIADLQLYLQQLGAKPLPA